MFQVQTALRFLELQEQTGPFLVLVPSRIGRQTPHWDIVDALKLSVDDEYEDAVIASGPTITTAIEEAERKLL